MSIQSRFQIDPCPTDAVLRLVGALGVSPVLAQVLVRRGFTEPEVAAAFLDPRDAHPPAAFDGIEQALAVIRDHVARGSPITVHGDYDCDGVCATAVLVGALRELGAVVDWFLPDRGADGYGLSEKTVDRLAERGTRLLITADCAITAVDAVARARVRGVDVVVTDHHRPRADGVLPDAPIVHPVISGYPCPDLCATAVAAKLADALRDASGVASHTRDLELVALATVADVVPLRGENRRLVREGLQAIAATRRPGLLALMAIADVDPARVDERVLAFRLAPRLNAAGRLYRPDTGLELLLTADEQRAAALAAELDRANTERRHVETGILFEAETMLAQHDDDEPAVVLAGEGWHAGVIGIVASRIAERRHRPTVLIALPPAGTAGPGRGSARSIPGFDLLGGLEAASEHLLRHGGHRAAAGLEIAPQNVAAFTTAFTAHAASVLRPDDLIPVERVDAVASAEDVGIELAEELRRLAPFGAGNPQVSLLLPAARLADARGFGGERRDQHARFSVESGAARAGAVAFGNGPRPPLDCDRPLDATFRLELNEWRGAIEPRLVLRAARYCAPAPIVDVGCADGYLASAFAELDRIPGSGSDAAGGKQRRRIDRRDRSIAATLTALTGAEPALVVCAHAELRAGHLRGRLGGFDLCAYAALVQRPSIAESYRDVVLLDPPSSEAEATACLGGREDGFAHLVWGAPELRFAQHINEQEYGLRAPLTALYRSLRDAGGAGGADLESVLRGAGTHPRSPWLAGRLLRVLAELRLIEVHRERRAVSVLEAERTELERSIAYQAYQRRLQDGRRYLSSNQAMAA